MELSPLLQPIEVGPFRLRNRLMLTTHNPKMTDVRYRAYLRERMKGGIGLVGIPILHEAVTSLTFVSTGRIDPSYSADWDAPPDAATAAGQTFFDNLLLPRLRACAEIAHEHGAIIFGQVADRGAARLPEMFQPRIAPSPVVDPQVCAVPHELETDSVERIISIFGKSAARIKNAGLDGVEIHGAHGYLVEQFLSPLTNHRTDRYGGSFENRLRFLEEIIQSIRHECGPDFPIGLRMTAHQEVADGWTIEDSKKLVTTLGKFFAYINVTAGTIKALRHGVTLPYVAPWPFSPGFNASAAAAIKAVSPTPIIVTGRFSEVAGMERVLTEGQADMIGVTRALMADPQFLSKVESGNVDRIRKCIGANECHYPDRPSGCAVNAALGREEELRFSPAAKPKRVLVVGGGPAGLEAARVASLRGHQVTVLEKSSTLGGQIAVVGTDKNRGDMRTYLDFLIGEVKQQDITIELDVEATLAIITGHQADALIIATGSRPDIPHVPKLRRQSVFSACDVFRGVDDVGQRVLVVGGLDDHLKPPTTAEFLADQGRHVTLITQCMMVGQGLEPAAMHLLLKRLMDKGIEMQTLTELVSSGDKPVLRNVFSERETELDNCDSIVFAHGHRVNDDLWSAAKGVVRESYRIGDCLAPRRLVQATLDGARIGARL